jgi:protein-tyrosine phosphatase
MSQWFLAYGFADVADELLLGAYPLDRDDVQMLERLGIDRIVNLVEDSEYAPGVRDLVADALDAAGIVERRLPLTDYAGLPSIEIEAAVRQVNEWLDEGHRVYLHCRAGWQRSAAVAAGVIAIRDGVGIDDALTVVQQRKPTADPLPHQREDLEWWWRERPDGSSSEPGRDAVSDVCSAQERSRTPPGAADRPSAAE